MNNKKWVQRINSLGESVGGTKNLIEINANKLIKKAIESTGLYDFGDDQWKSSLSALVTDLNNIDEPHVLGRLINKATILIALRNRLHFVNHLSNHPEILNEKIDSPLIITGLPRTGTTILYEILSQDSNYRTPKGFEAYFPTESGISPLLNTSELKKSAECLFELTMDIEPEIKLTHDNRADLPAECWMIISSLLGNPRPDFYSDREYRNRFFNIDSNYNYSWHKKGLQLLQHQTPSKKWLLKCPSHLHFMKSMFNIYPSAKVIHMHRDPVSAIPSLLNHLKCFEQLDRKHNPNKDHTSVLSLMEGGLKKTIDQRKANIIPNEQIADIHFNDLMRNPIDTIKITYEKLGITFRSDFGYKIKKYLEKRPRNKHGVHKYNSIDFNLSNQIISERFKFYTDHYRIDIT